MTKKNDPPFGEPPTATHTLHPFSNNRELEEGEWLALRLASTTRFRSCEPMSITKARSRITSAEKAIEHLLKEDLIPLCDSFDFEGMFLKGFNSGR
jgi:hypothetical protein